MDKQSSKIELLIELDDPSHLKQKAIRDDCFKDELTKNVGIPLLRVSVNDDYLIDDLISKIETAVLESS